MISIQHLRKQFGDLIAVDNLSLKIFSGEILGFLGPNGAGKTTVINMLCGLLEPDKGSIHWDDNSGRLTGSIGICTQENIYWPRLTCWEQLVFMGRMYDLPDKLSQKRAADLLETLGLADKKDVLADELSGGMKRRLNIALALIHDPRILVLDEPEAGLDPQSRLLVRKLIKSLSRKKTVILTTHNMDEAERLADRVAIIDKGKLLKLDTIENLKTAFEKGDVLEIKLINSIPKALNSRQLEQALNTMCDRVIILEKKLQLQSPDILEKIPEIMSRLKQNGLEVNEIQLRKTTLEDVFIQLTGRELRD